MVIPNLTTNTVYEVKVKAATLSTINPKQLVLGSYSDLRTVRKIFKILEPRKIFNI